MSNTLFPLGGKLLSFLKILYWVHLVWMGNESNEYKNAIILDCSYPLGCVD